MRIIQRPTTALLIEANEGKATPDKNIGYVLESLFEEEFMTAEGIVDWVEGTQINERTTERAIQKALDSLDRRGFVKEVGNGYRLTNKGKRASYQAFGWDDRD